MYSRENFSGGKRMVCLLLVALFCVTYVSASTIGNRHSSGTEPEIVTDITPGVDPNRFEPVTVSSCMVLSNPGRYVLSTSLQSNGTCLIIRSQDVLIDGNGFEVVGNGSGHGVWIDYHDRTRIHNLTIREFGTGVYGRNTTGVLLQGVNVQDSEIGLRFTGGNSPRIIDSKFTDNQHGIVLSQISRTFIERTRVSGNTGTGIRVDASPRTLINNSMIISNNYSGILIMRESSGAEIYASDVTNQEGYGIRIEFSEQASINGGNISGNGLQGILVLHSPDVLIERVLTEHNEREGIRIESSPNAIIRHVISTGSKRNNIYISNSSESTLLNVSLSKGVAGLELRTSPRSKIVACSINQHQLHGIFIYNSSISLIEECNVSESGRYGLLFEQSTGIVVLGGKSINNNHSGIHIRHSSTSTMVRGMVLEQNKHGVYVEESTGTILRDLNVRDSRSEGILLNVGAFNTTLWNTSIHSSAIPYRNLKLTSIGINGTVIRDYDIGSYTIVMSTVTFSSGEHGSVSFLSAIDGTGNSLQNEIYFGHNLFTLSTTQSGMNVPARVMLTNLPTGRLNHQIFRNGVPCPNDVCRLLGPLDGASAEFVISGSGSYTIMSDPAPISMGAIDGSSPSGGGSSSSGGGGGSRGGEQTMLLEEDSLSQSIMPVASYTPETSNEPVQLESSSTITAEDANIFGPTYGWATLIFLLTALLTAGFLIAIWYRKRNGVYW